MPLYFFHLRDHADVALDPEGGDAASYNYAQVYAQAGEKDRAFSALSTAFNVRDAGLTGLKTDPFLDPIRSDPRFAALIRKLRFP